MCDRNLHDYIHVPIPAPLHFGHLRLGNASTMEVNTDWKSLQIFIFIDFKRPLNWLKMK